MRSQADTRINRSGLIYLMAGGAIGAGVALLFAPKSGREFREDISNTTIKGYDQAKEFTLNLSEKAKNVYGQAQAKALETYNAAKEGLNSTIESAKSGVAAQAEKVKSLPDQAGNLVSEGLEKIADQADEIAQEINHQNKKKKVDA